MLRMRAVLPTREKLEKGPLSPPCAGTGLAALTVFVPSARTMALRWNSRPLTLFCSGSAESEQGSTTGRKAERDQSLPMSSCSAHTRLSRSPTTALRQALLLFPFPRWDTEAQRGSNVHRVTQLVHGEARNRIQAPNKTQTHPQTPAVFSGLRRNRGK